MAAKGRSTADQLKYYKKKGTDVKDMRVQWRENRKHCRKDKKSQLLTKRRLGSEPDDVFSPFFGSTSVKEQLQSISTSLSRDSMTALQGISHLDSMLMFSCDDVIPQVIAAGILPRLVRYLGEDNDADVQSETALVLTYIAAGTPDYTRAVVACNAVPMLIRLLRSPSDQVKDRAFWALETIASAGEDFRDDILDHGIMQPLIAVLMESTDLAVIKSGLFCLPQLLRDDLSDTQGLFVVLCLLLEQQNVEVLEKACWALKNILMPDTCGEFVRNRACQRLLDLLQHESDDVVDAALAVVNIIVSEDETHVDTLLGYALLPRLLYLLLHKVWSQEVTCSILSVVAGRSSYHLQAVIDAGLVHLLVRLLSAGPSDVKFEAVHAILRATELRNPEQTRVMVQIGCIAPLCDILNTPDPEMIGLVLCTFIHILHVGHQPARGARNPYAEEVVARGGLERIERLVNNENEEISEFATKIIDQFFQSEEETDQFEPHWMDTADQL